MRIKLVRLRIMLILAILILTNCTQLLASPQVPDYIIYKNDTLPTYNLIFEEYLSRHYPEGLSFGIVSTGCVRGYQAIYKIENDSLFLVDIIGYNYDKELSENNIQTIFGNKVKDNKVFVDWFSGEINFPTISKSKQNKVIRLYNFFENIFLFETLVKIEKGKIKHSKDIQNYIDAPNKINRQAEDTIRIVLFEHIKNYKIGGKTKDFFCSDEYRIRINKKGRIDLVEIVLPQWTQEEINKFYEKEDMENCIRSLKNAFKGLRFDIIKRRGKPIEEYVYITMWFDDDGKIERWDY